MLVLGIDPGIAITGFGLVKVSQAGDLQVVTFGVLDSTAVRATSSRLVYLYDHLTSLITQYQPSFAAVERLFFQKNIKTAMEVSEARGVIELCLEQRTSNMLRILRMRSNSRLPRTVMLTRNRYRRW